MRKIRKYPVVSESGNRYLFEAEIAGIDKEGERRVRIVVRLYKQASLFLKTKKVFDREYKIKQTDNYLIEARNAAVYDYEFENALDKGFQERHQVYLEQFEKWNRDYSKLDLGRD